MNEELADKVGNYCLKWNNDEPGIDNYNLKVSIKLSETNFLNIE